MKPDFNELAIWWLNQTECEAIGWDAPEILPDYLKTEYKSRLGRPGRGRLWIPHEIGSFDIEWPEPETPIAKYLGDTNSCGGSGGIVFWQKDIDALSILPGLITDMWLNRL